MEYSTQEQQKEDPAVQRAHQQIEAEDQGRQLGALKEVANAKLHGVDAKAAEAKHKELEKAWLTLCIALKIDQASVNQLNKKGTVRGLVNMAYLLVLVGCELDLYGFAMAFPVYWDMGEKFIRALLVIGPIGYVLAALMYMYYCKIIEDRIAKAKEDENEQANRGPQQLKFVQPQSKDAWDSVTPAAQQGQSQMWQPKQTITLRYYHFTPIVRYFLVVKEKEVDDIEGIFRVNSLSSFSLGIAQICSIIFQGIQSEGNMSVFTWINIVSQIINWGITIMYFTTSVASKMSSAMKVQSMIASSDFRLRKKMEHWRKIVNAEADNLHNPVFAKDKDTFIESIHREIEILAAVSGVELGQYPMEHKFIALKYLYRRQDMVYSSI